MHFPIQEGIINPLDTQKSIWTFSDKSGTTPRKHPNTYLLG